MSEWAERFLDEPTEPPQKSWAEDFLGPPPEQSVAPVESETKAPLLDTGPSLESVGTEASLIDRDRTITEFASRTGLKVDMSEPGASLWDRVGFEATPKYQDIVKKYRKDHGENAAIAKMEVPGLDEPVLMSKQDLLDDQEPWRLVNQTGFDIGDLAPLIEDLPAIVAQTALAYSTGGGSALAMRGAGALKQGIMQGAAGMGIRAGQDAIQAQKGYDPSYWKSATESIFDTFAVMPGAAFEKAGGEVAGMESTPISKALQELQQTTGKDLKLPPSAHLPYAKIIERIQMQARQTFGGIDRAEDKVKKDLTEIVQNMTGNGASREAGQYLKGSATQLVEKRLAESKTKLLIAGKVDEAVSLAGADKEARLGIREWDTTTRIIKDKKYADFYNEVGEADIDISKETKATAMEIAEDIRLRNEAGELESISLRESQTDIIKAANEILRRPGDQPLTEIRRLRSKLSDYFEVGIQGMDASQRQAKRLYDALGRDLDNFAKEAGTKAESLWKNANGYYMWRQGVKETRVVKEVASLEQPADVVRKYLIDPQEETLKVIKETTGIGFERIKKAYFSFLASNPARIDEAVRNLEENTSKAQIWRDFISPRQKDALKELGLKYKRIQGHPYQKILDSYADVGHSVVSLLDDKGIGPDIMKEFVRDVGGEGSSGHTLLKAGIADALFMKTIKRNRNGELQIDPRAFRTEIERWQSGPMKGTLETLFSPIEMAILKNVDVVNSYFMRGGDVGASMSMNAIVADLKRGTGLNPSAALQAAHDLLVNRTLGMILMSDAMHNFLLTSKTYRPTSLPFLKAMSMAADNTYDTITQHLEENTATEESPAMGMP